MHFRNYLHNYCRLIVNFKTSLLFLLALTSSFRLFGQREIILNTTGYGFDKNSVNGINPDQWTYIQKFATLKSDGKDASVTAVRLHIQWENYEPTLNNYQGAKIALAVKAILDLNPNMKVALHFPYMRSGYWNDDYFETTDLSQTSQGTLMRNSVSYACPSVYSDYAIGRFQAFVADALSNIQPYYSKVLYVAMGNTPTEEFYVPGQTSNDIWYPGLYEAKAAASWRTKFLPRRFPNQTNATWGRNTYAVSSAPQPTDGNYNSDMGRDFHRFAGWGLLNLYKAFYETVKSKSSSIKVLHFISDFGSVQGNNWHLHNSTIPLALELSDGIYSSDGTDQYDLWKKIMAIDCIKGTSPDKIAAIEFDPQDLGQPRGQTGVNGNTATEWFQRAFKHGADYVHIAMHFYDNEIAQIAGAIASTKTQFLKPDYQPPARSEPTTVNIYPAVFTSTFLFQEWLQKSGSNFSVTDAKPVSIKMTDAGYWNNIWNTTNYLPCTFSITASNSQPKPVVGTPVTLSIDCTGPECDGASYQWTGTGVTSDQTGSSITIDAPTTTGEFTYSVTSSRSGCATKTASTALSVTLPLPVKLIEFTAVRENQTTLLSWSTSEEINSERFEIEHSTTGRNWNKIGTVAASGETSQKIRYSFTDINPSAGQNLYRLKMVDLDETFAYSKIVNVNFNDKVQLTTYPNPVTQVINIAADNWDHVKTIKILNNSGNVVYKSDSPQPEINVGHLSAGAYIIGLTRSNGDQETAKFVKKE